MPDSGKKWEVVACSEGATLLERGSGQLMHSRIGPWAEANAVYVAQSGHFLEPARGDSAAESPVIYDVGMGIAANALAAVAAFDRLRIFSFERHPAALAAALEQPESFPFHAPYREALRTLLERGEWSAPSLEWKLISGDFREVPLGELPPADLVYFDFYAPSVCPELWSVEVFSRLRPKMTERGLLITYSTAKSVRASLLLAGFFVGEGASTAMKRATTLASPKIDGIGGPGGLAGPKPLDGSWLASLERSTKPLPDGWRGLGSHPQFKGIF